MYASVYEVSLFVDRIVVTASQSYLLYQFYMLQDCVRVSLGQAIEGEGVSFLTYEDMYSQVFLIMSKDLCNYYIIMLSKHVL